MPNSAGNAGLPFKDHRLVAEGIIYRYRAGIPWSDLAEHFGFLEERLEAPPPIRRRGNLGH